MILSHRRFIKLRDQTDNTYTNIIKIYDESWLNNSSIEQDCFSEQEGVSSSIMENLNLELINNEIETFIQERDWDQFHSIKNLTMALSVEASELAEIFQWMKEADSNAVALNSDLKSKVEEEVADVLIYLLRIANKSSINLEQAVLAKIKKNAKKYPAEKVRGSSKKYSEY
jgi:dCTP diphosphatase